MGVPTAIHGNADLVTHENRRWLREKMLQQNLRARAPPFHDRDLVFCESYRRAACLTPRPSRVRLPV